MVRCFLNRTGAFVLIFAVLFVLCGQAAALDFSADMTQTQGEEVKSNKIYVKGDRYSFDLEEDGEKLLVVVDTKNNRTVIVVYSAKEYREMPSDHIMSVMNDPFQGYLYTAEMGKEQAAGAETVNGYECDKFVIVMQDAEVMTKWVARKLNFPIKIVTSQGGPIMELTNIVEGPVADTWFEIPEGFTKWIDPETLPAPIPDWASNLETAPLMDPPFEQVMNAGDIVRIKPMAGKSLKVKAADKSSYGDETEIEARVIPFKDARPLKKEKDYYNLMNTFCSVRHETVAAADEFVVYVYKGTIKIVAKWQDMTEQEVAAGEEFRYKIEGFDNIEVFMVNTGDGEAVETHIYYKDGAPISEEDAGPVKWRTTLLEEPGEMIKTTWSAKNDEMVVSVEKGKMQIKMGQYDTFEF